MKTIKFQVPANRNEVALLIKRSLLNYDKVGFVIGLTTIVSLGWSWYFENASQDFQRGTVLAGLLIYAYLAFTIFVAKSAEAQQRRWWLWIIVSFVFPFIGIIAVIIFKTSPKN